METLVETEKKAETNQLELKTYYGFGFSGDHLNKPFIIVSKSRTPPFALKGLRLIWVIGAINTDKCLSVKCDYEPSVGDVGNTHQGEIIEVMSVNYY